MLTHSYQFVADVSFFVEKQANRHTNYQNVFNYPIEIANYSQHGTKTLSASMTGHPDTSHHPTAIE